MFRALLLALTLTGFATILAPSPSFAGSAPLTVDAPVDMIAGTYAIQGDNFSGGAPYDGEVLVEKTGAVYQVTWYPGPNQIKGVGIFWGGQFSVGYLQEGVQGVAVYVPVAGGLRGVWSELGETRLAPEDWVKR